jgi:hypothetical protein
MTKLSIVAVAALTLAIAASAGAQTPTLPYDHIHLLIRRSRRPGTRSILAARALPKRRIA